MPPLTRPLSFGKTSNSEDTEDKEDSKRAESFEEFEDSEVSLPSSVQTYVSKVLLFCVILCFLLASFLLPSCLFSFIFFYCIITDDISGKTYQGVEVVV